MDSTADARIEKLCHDFEGYLKVFEENNPFKPGQWDIHRKTIEMRNRLATVDEAIESDEFLKSLRDTLASWGVNRGRRVNGRGGLVVSDKFISQFRSTTIRERIIALEGKHFTQLDSDTSEIEGMDIREMLKITMVDLRLSESSKQVVAGSKALHHVLPSLLPPIDNAYTGRFFSASDIESPSETYDILNGFAKIGQCLQKTKCKDYLSDMVDNTVYPSSQRKSISKGFRSGRTGHSTSETKLIDNAIIGYVKKHS